MIITQTPLRISLLGGNTDFKEYYLNYEGTCLTTTIDKYIYCIVSKRFDNLIIVNYSIKEIVEDVNKLKHELVREALKALGITGGVEITFLADIPTQGTGLGSSSAVTVGVLNALHTFKGEAVSSMQLAEEAIEIELNILKKPIGVQDQYAVALGGLRALKFFCTGDVHGDPILIDESVKEDFNNSLMIFYTGIQRQTDDILAGFDIKVNKDALDDNKILARQGIQLLEAGALRPFGYLLDTYWNIKKRLSNKITTLEIDEMYEKAMKAGALGGKVIGAGGGGFLLIMFPANKRAVIRKALRLYRELPFRLTDQGSKVLLNI